MERIKAALMQWGEAMQVRMENRTLHYSPILGHWRVKKWSGVDARSFLYDGESFEDAFLALLGSNAGKITEAEQGRED
jgi:hypothetical protein